MVPVDHPQSTPPQVYRNTHVLNTYTYFTYIYTLLSVVILANVCLNRKALCNDISSPDCRRHGSSPVSPAGSPGY